PRDTTARANRIIRSTLEAPIDARQLSGPPKTLTELTRAVDQQSTVTMGSDPVRTTTAPSGSTEKVSKPRFLQGPGAGPLPPELLQPRSPMGGIGDALAVIRDWEAGRILSHDYEQRMAEANQAAQQRLPPNEQEKG